MENLQINSYQDLESMIVAGRFDRVEEVVKTFLVDVQTGYRVIPRIFVFDDDISSESVIKSMLLEGFRPAKLEELAAYAEASKSTESKTALVALGSNLKVLDVEGMKIPSMFLQTKSVRSSIYELLAYVDTDAIKGFESAVVELVSKLKPRQVGVEFVPYAILQDGARRLYVSPLDGKWWSGMSFLGVKDI